MLIEETLQTGTVYLAAIIEASAAVIIIIAAAKALYRFLLLSVRNGKQSFTKEEVRLSFGSALGISLEFLLAADILETAVAPSWNDIGQLAAIAVLRTALNYFLERELRGVEKNKALFPEKPVKVRDNSIEKAIF